MHKPAALFPLISLYLKSTPKSILAKKKAHPNSAVLKVSAGVALRRLDRGHGREGFALSPARQKGKAGTPSTAGFVDPEDVGANDVR